MSAQTCLKLNFHHSLSELVFLELKFSKSFLCDPKTGRKFPCLLQNQFKSVSDLEEIYDQSWGHIVVFRDIRSSKLSSQQPCP